MTPQGGEGSNPTAPKQRYSQPVRAWVLVLGIVMLAPCARADELIKPGPLGRTIQFDPHAKTARLAARELARLGPAGWAALRKLITGYDVADERAAGMLADALAGGHEPERHEVIADLLRKVQDPRVRRTLIRALAVRYPAHGELVHAHLMEGGLDGPRVLRAIAERVSDDTARTLMASRTVGYEAYKLLRSRDVLPDAQQLAPLARTLARQGLTRGGSAAFAKAFATHPDFELLRAIVHVRSAKDAALRRGAYLLLLEVTGAGLPPDGAQWLSWIRGRKAFYEPPAPVSDGVIEAAILRGAHYLLADLDADGKAIWRPGQSEVGSTALAVIAVRAAGTPANHPAIQKALSTTLLRPNGELPALDGKHEVYSLALLARALTDLDARRHARVLAQIRDRLVGGQASNGQWTYAASRDEGALPALKGDGSNTQHALLGLRALRRAKFDAPRETWQRAATYFQGNANMAGGWGYKPGDGSGVSMSAAAITGLAACLEALHGDGAAEAVARDASIARGWAYLGTRLLLQGVAREESYARCGIVRAARLSGVSAFQSAHRALDLTRACTEHLVRTQREDGAWGNANARSDVRGTGYGFVVDTAFALLTLRATTPPIVQATKTIRVDIKGEKPPPAPPPGKGKPGVESRPPTPTRSPLLTVDALEVYTNGGAVEITGNVAGPGLRVNVGGVDASIDAHGRFAATVSVSKTRDVPVVVLRAGKERERMLVRAVLDVVAPQLQLVGDARRPVGKQTVRFRANEPLRGLRTSTYFAPGDNRIVDLPVELPPGKPVVHVVAMDRAGNVSKHRFTFDVKNRVLVLDGKSAVRVDLKEKPGTFTAECWFRSDGTQSGGASVLVADTERSGFAIHWYNHDHALPTGYVHASGKYLVCRASRRPRPKRWHHAALTYDGEEARFFLNGKLQQTQAGKPIRLSTRALFVGADPVGNNRPNSFFVGAIDDVRISRVVRYTKNFKPTKVHARDRHTLLLLHFDVDTPTSFADDSPTGHKPTPAGTPQIVEMRR